MDDEFKLAPCREPEEPCDFECGSDDDIRDKDLAVLLKEEAAKIQAEKKDLDTSKARKSDSPKKKEPSDSEEEQRGKKEPSDSEGEQRGKKRPCRKVIKNPFFTNRLKFSSDLPPRPPFPPPQFFPLADEDSKPKVCPKKKKCKKKKVKSITELTDDISKAKGGIWEEEDTEEGEGVEKKEEEEKEKEEKEEEECIECKCDEEFAKPKIFRKPKEKKNLPPCRKKASDLSIPPQPRRIPALMKDLPLTCPKDIPEVERQIWMSRDSEMRSACKKKCKKKETIEQLLNQ